MMSAPKRRVADVSDILTWTEAFSIYQMVLCHYHPNRWEDLSRYKLLIIQTARQYPGPAWLDYDLAFRKDAAASGLTDWSKMNLDLYNFHLRTPQAPSTRQMIQTSATTSSTGDGDPTPPARYCHSWNEGKCRWSLGRCRFRHTCMRCNGEHPKIRCPYQSHFGLRSRSPSPSRKGSRP